MKTKIVYTVVSGNGDIYLPQAMVAAYTARRYNPSANIILVTDQPTSSVIDAKLSAIKNYVNDVVVVDLPEELSNMQRSRYLKTTLRRNVKGDFLYIDTDTVVTRDLSEIDNLKIEIGAVLDRHIKIDKHIYQKKIKKDVSAVGLKISDLRNCYYNGGVIFVKDTPLAYELYDLWHKYWNDSRVNGKSIDQPALAKANKDCNYPIQELNGIWNCQLSDNFINYLADAKILHYFASNKKSPYKLFDNDIFLGILNNGDLPNRIRLFLENPKQIFREKHQLIFDDDVDFSNTYVHTMYSYHKRIFNIMEYISKVIVTKKT